MSKIDKPAVIGVLGLGSMGSGIAADLKRSGFDVVSALEGRSERTRARAEKAGIRVLANLAEVVRAADTFLSVVPSDQAEPLADAVAKALGAAPRTSRCTTSIATRSRRRARPASAPA